MKQAYTVALTSACQHGMNLFVMFGVYETSAEAVSSAVRSMIEGHGYEHPVSITSTVCHAIAADTLAAAAAELGLHQLS